MAPGGGGEATSWYNFEIPQLIHKEINLDH